MRTERWWIHALVLAGVLQVQIASAADPELTVTGEDCSAVVAYGSGFAPHLMIHVLVGREISHQTVEVPPGAIPISDEGTFELPIPADLLDLCADGHGQVVVVFDDESGRLGNNALSR
jgi:hypothetical protein